MVKDWVGLVVNENRIIIGKITRTYEYVESNDAYKIYVKNARVFGINNNPWEEILSVTEYCFEAETFDTLLEAERGLLAFVMNFGVDSSGV